MKKFSTLVFVLFIIFNFLNPSTKANLLGKSGDYWIIQLGEQYEYAVVGHPGRKYLWILSRTPKMEPAMYEQICDRLIEQGYDPKRLIVAKE